VRFQRFDERYIVRLEAGESALQTLARLLEAERVDFANVSGAGAVEWVRLAYWNRETRQYEEREFDEQLEVVSFQGNMALKEGKPFLHLHGVFSRRDFSTIGGHVKEARVHPTLEVWLRTEDIPVRRSRDEPSGLELLDLPLGSPPAEGLPSWTRND